MNQYWLVSIRYFCVVAIAYALKKIGVFQTSDSRLIGTIIMKLTLPAVIISSFKQVEINSWLLVCLGLGIFLNLFLLGTALLISKNMPAKTRALWAVSAPGYNLGNITIPFLQGIFPQGIPYVGLFDTGDSLITFGGTYIAANLLLSCNKQTRIRDVIRTLFSSLPFVSYITMTTVSFLQIRIPAGFLNFCTFVGESNALLAMLLIGISLDFNPGKVNFTTVFGLLIFRIFTSIVFALGVYYLLPKAPIVMRQALMIALFSAITNVSLIFAGQYDLDMASASLCNTLSTLLALPVLSVVSGIVL